MDILFNEVINTVIYSPENTTHIPDAPTLAEQEEAEIRRRLTALLETIGDSRTEYLNFLDAYIKNCQEHCYKQRDCAE